jgi:hypothetical protein
MIIVLSIAKLDRGEMKQDVNSVEFSLQLELVLNSRKNVTYMTNDGIVYSII